MARLCPARRDKAAPQSLSAGNGRKTLTQADRETLALENQDLVQSQASKLKNQLPAHLERDELVAHGQIGLLKAIDSYNPSHIPFRVWASFTIRNAILDAFRRKRYREEMNPGLDHAPEQTVDPDPDSALLQKDQRRRIELGLRRLPADERRAVRTILDEKYLAHQARVEGVSEVTICTRRLKGLQRLREYMERLDLTADDLL